MDKAKEICREFANLGLVRPRFEMRTGGSGDYTLKIAALAISTGNTMTSVVRGLIDTACIERFGTDNQKQIIKEIDHELH